MAESSADSLLTVEAESTRDSPARRGPGILGALRAACRCSHWVVACHDLVGRRERLRADAEHLRAAMGWLCRAQDACDGGGVSAGYYFTSGWLPPYPETTGYIIETFLRYASTTGEQSYYHRAVRMGDWELRIQLPGGGVRGQIGIQGYPIVFNTGQVMLGWSALYRETREQRFLDGAIRAADWLVSVQDADGKWSRHDHAETPHAYQTRVAWPLFELAAITGCTQYHTAGEQLVRWVLSQVGEHDWIEHMAFVPAGRPYTHTIAYTLRGLLESSSYLDEALQQQVRLLVLRVADRLMHRFELRKSDPRGQPRLMPGEFEPPWRPTADYCCLTGNAQLAIVWLLLYRLDGDLRFVNGALKLLDQVKSTQRMRSLNPGIRGAVAGSYPIWGGYERFGYPNWAVKFLADAIMLQEEVVADVSGSDRDG